MIRAASLDTSIDLRPFSEQLSRQGLPHRIIEEAGQQAVYVESEAAARFVREALAQWQASDGITPPAAGATWEPGARVEKEADREMDAVPVMAPRGDPLYPVRRVLSGSPVTLTLIAITLLVALFSALGSRADRVDFLFYPLLASDSLGALLADMTSPVLWLRSLTPMFLHFGELHLIFNMLWLWFFGKQLESIQPGWLILALILVMAFVSNTTQYLSVQSNSFGGMSGVVYGLVGYAWIIHNFMPRSYLMINNSMFVFFVIALILMEMVAGSWIATAAHVGGLVAGVLLGLAVVGYYRIILKREVVGRRRSGFI